MPFVLDASVTVSWGLARGRHGEAVAAFDRLRGDNAFVPATWWFEVRNALLLSERRRLTTEGDTARFLRHLSDMRIVIDRSPDEDAVLALARRNRLTVYEAAYLELAARHRVPLATLDGALAGAGRAEGVELLGAT
jgi:predicted nucleic acid-binding protein